MTGDTPGRAQPRTIGTPPARRPFPTQLVILAVAVIVVVLVVKACVGGENKYEKIAHQLTEAVQNNDYNAVAKLENPETAAEMGRGRLGRAADALAPLGKVKKVKEVDAADLGVRWHRFNVSFDKGSVQERIQFDPQDKVFHFTYDAPHKGRV